MKNLKKALALVLAIALCFSLVTVAGAANNYDDYADASTVEAEDALAVNIVTGLKIIDGKDGNKLDLSGNLTRAEAAKILTVLNLGTDLAASVNSSSVDTGFSDTAKNWASGYIAYCVSQGYLTGYNGKFDPNGQLTGYAFGKMLLNVLGYGLENKQIEGTTTTVNSYEGSQWAINVAVDGNKINLFKNVDSDLSSAITRVDAMNMVFNALEQAYALGEKVDDVEGASEIKDFQKFYALSDNFEYDKADDDSDEFGAPVTKYSITYKNGKTVVLATAADEALATITDGSFDLSDSTVKTWKNYDFSSITTATIIYNGEASVVTWSTKDELAKPGYTVALYGAYSAATSKYVVSKIVVTEYNFAKITDVSADGETIDITAYGTDGTEYDWEVTYTEDGTEAQNAEYNLLKGYAKDTYLAVVVKDLDGSPKALAVATPKTATGTVSTTKIASYSGYAVLGGTKYTLANNFVQATVSVKDEGTFYLDPNGYVLKFIKTSEVESDTLYAYVVKTSQDTTDIWADEATEMAKLVLLSTGETVTAKLKNGVDSQSETKPDGSVVTYEVNSDGTYTLTAGSSATASTNNTSSSGLSITKGNANGKIAGSAVVFNSKTIFLVITKAADGVTPVYTVYNGIANVPSLEGTTGTKAAAIAGTTAQAVVVVDGATESNATSTNTYYIIGNNSGAIIDVDLGTYYEYAAIINGEITTVKSATQYTSATLASTANTKSNGVYASFTGTVNVTATATGTKALDNGLIGLNKASYVYYTVSSDCAVYVIDTKGVATKSSVSAIKTDDNDTVIYTLKDGVVTSLYIQKVAD